MVPSKDVPIFSAAVFTVSYAIAVLLDSPPLPSVRRCVGEQIRIDANAQ